MILLLLVIIAVLLWFIQAENQPDSGAEKNIEIACPACRKPVEIDWMVCPHCQQRLRETCNCCHKGKLIGHEYCPFCGSSAKGAA